MSLPNLRSLIFDGVFQFSVGLNGVGTKAVNALFKEFIVRSFSA